MTQAIVASSRTAAAALCLAVAVLAQTPGHSVQDVQIFTGDESTQIAILTAGKVAFRYNRLSNPDRIYVDLLNTEAQEREIKVADSVVERVRLGGSEPGAVRVVVDLTARAPFNVTQLQDPDRLVIEVRQPLVRHNIRDIQISEAGAATRIAIETATRIDFESNQIPNPDRIFFDFPNSSAQPRRIEVGSSTVEDVRVAYTQPTVTRIVVDLTGPAVFRTAWMENPTRLIVQIERAENVGQPVLTSSAATQAGETAEPIAAAPPEAEAQPAPSVSLVETAETGESPQPAVSPAKAVVPLRSLQQPRAAPPPDAAPPKAPAPPEPVTSPPAEAKPAETAEVVEAAAASASPSASTFNADGKLHYDIHWPTGITQGEASLETTAGGAVIEFRFDASLPGVPVAGEFQSRLNPDGCTVAFSKKYAFGLRSAQETLTIADGKLTRRTGAEGGESARPAGGCLYDALAFLNFLRQELNAGRMPEGRRILFGAQYDLTLKRLDSGKEDVDRVEISVKGPASSHTFEIDFRRDPLRTPFRVRIPLPLGEFALELVE